MVIGEPRLVLPQGGHLKIGWVKLSLLSITISLVLASQLPAVVRTTNLILPGEQNPRTAMVQLFEWPWQDVAIECETYLGPNGFAAVHVSPPMEHLVWEKSPWWERYQPISYRLISRGGDEAEFRDMIERCSRAHVDVYVDVVLNHMAGIEEGIGHAGTRFTHYEYPGLYTYQDFHHCGRNGNDNIVNFSDAYELLNCELVNLADLATESPKVRSMLANYLNRLIDMGAKGFRIDAAKHMPAQDIKAILNLLTKKVYIFQELVISPGEPINALDYLPNGDITMFAYPFDVGRAFKHRHVDELQQVGFKNGYLASTDAIVFNEDHDLQRNADHQNEILTFTRDGELYRLANIFLLTWPYGYPRLFSGYSFDSFDQGPPVDDNRKTLPVLDRRTKNCRAPWLCEHRLRGMAAAAQFRNVTNSNFFYSDWWSNNYDQLAFGRGNLGFVVINLSQNPLQRTFQTSLPPGNYCNVVSESFDTQTHTCLSDFVVVSSNRTAKIIVKPLDAVIIHVAAPALRKVSLFIEH